MTFGIHSVNFKKLSNHFILTRQIIENSVKKKISINTPILLFGEEEGEKAVFNIWLKKSLGQDFPFSAISSIYNSKNEIEQLGEITKTQKKSIGLRISEYVEYYEGEVFDLILNVKPTSDLEGNFSAIVGLKTTEGKLRLKISGKLYRELLIKKIEIGEIIRIIPEIYSIQNLGKSINFINASSIYNSNFVSIPKGKVSKKKILIKEITLFEFEFENCKNKNNFEFENAEILGNLTNDIQALILKYNKFGKADIFRGIMFIDQAHNLAPICLHFLTRACNDQLFPTTILSTNKISLLVHKKFSLDSFKLESLKSWLIIPFENFPNYEILKIICLNFLNEKIFFSGLSVRILKKTLQISDPNFTISLVFLTNIGIKKEKFSWICKNTLKFFNLIILHSAEFFYINCSKNNYVKIYRSF